MRFEFCSLMQDVSLIVGSCIQPHLVIREKRIGRRRGIRTKDFIPLPLRKLSALEQWALGDGSEILAQLLIAGASPRNRPRPLDRFRAARGRAQIRCERRCAACLTARNTVRKKRRNPLPSPFREPNQVYFERAERWDWRSTEQSNCSPRHESAGSQSRFTVSRSASTKIRRLRRPK